MARSRRRSGPPPARVPGAHPPTGPSTAAGLVGPRRSLGGRTWTLAGAALLAIVLLAFLAWRWGGGAPPVGPSTGTVSIPPARPPGGSTGSLSRLAAVVEPQPAAFAKYAGSASCRPCHTNAFALWQGSHHAWAEREPSEALDLAGFVPERGFAHGSQFTTLRRRDGTYEMETAGGDGTNQVFRLERVLGHAPLRQFLVPTTGGRWQATEACWDPRTNEWFNVYGNEDRRPGEWGHWTGRGMNWNSMCATCHNTRFRKNYEALEDGYRSAMAEVAVGCEACHGPMRDHVTWQRAWEGSGKRDPTLVRWTPAVHMETCAACHARRSDLTGDLVPGESFWDHYLLAIVDDSDTFHADGQIWDEDYEYTAFLGSRMHAAGVTCLGCHQVHGAKPKLEGDALCMQCHDGRRQGSPVIDPGRHTFHAPESTGSRCVNCHMPQTVYMQRHWRHDHGFTSPDPVLTREHGIPNACNRCHADKTAEWSVEACEKWYGSRMERPARRRARVMAQARAGDVAAVPGLLEVLAIPETPYWKAVAAGFLARWLDRPGVVQALLGAAAHEHPLVRYRAIQSLAPMAEAGDPRVLAVVRAGWNDPARSVRFTAAWADRGAVPAESRAGQELVHALTLNADQPAGQAQWAAYALARGQPEVAVRHMQRAVGWDGGSAPLRQDLATLLSLTGRAREALEQVRASVRLEPRVAEHHYRLGLALHEAGEVGSVVAALEEAVRLDPRHDRALYNLGLAYAGQARMDEAAGVLGRAEAVNPGDPRIPYALATVLAQAGKAGEARMAAERALARQPGYPPALEFLGQLGR